MACASWSYGPSGVACLTDAFGTEVGRLHYGVCGELQPNTLLGSSATPDPSVKFRSQWLDGETGLCYYGARYYDPEIGRLT